MRHRIVAPGRSILPLDRENRIPVAPNRTPPGVHTVAAVTTSDRLAHLERAEIAGADDLNFDRRRAGDREHERAQEKRPSPRGQHRHRLPNHPTIVEDFTAARRAYEARPWLSEDPPKQWLHAQNDACTTTEPTTGARTPNRPFVSYRNPANRHLRKEQRIPPHAATASPEDRAFPDRGQYHRRPSTALRRWPRASAHARSELATEPVSRDPRDRA